MIIADSLTSKEMVQMYSGQLLMFIGQTMQGHVNWALSIIASLLGLVVVLFSIINAIKKAKISDLEIENLKLEKEKLEHEKLNRNLVNEN
jgi:cell shape-determining protein MreC